MPSTDKVLALIGALNTLVENFPMSILDLFKGKTYNSVFEFLIDVLATCGIDVNEVIEIILKEIYSIVPDIENGLEEFKEDLAAKDFTNVQQSKILNTIEYGIKGILMTLLSSMYGCSAIPIIPDRYIDKPCKDTFSTKDGKNNERRFNNVTAFWQNNIYPLNLQIPIKLIDPMGLLELCPTTTEGRIYYEVKGADNYYEKIPIPINKYGSNNQVKSTNNSSIGITFEVTEINDEDEKDKRFSLKIKTEDEVELTEKVDFTLTYFEFGNGLKKEWKTSIDISCNESEEFELHNSAKIVQLYINGEIGGTELTDKTWCYISKNIKSELSFHGIDCTIDFGNSNGPDNDLEDFIFDSNNNYNDKNGYYDSDGDWDPEAKDDFKYEYVKISNKKLTKDIKNNAKRLNGIPSEVTENDPNYIVIYNGTMPNELYKTNDMNAFIWYTITKSTRISQLEINHTMWDSRLPALKLGCNRDNGEGITWDVWYNSKKNSADEFKVDDGKTYIRKEDFLYPILQLQKSPHNTYSIEVSFPAQRYYKTKYRDKILNGTSGDRNMRTYFNSSIYRFNWEYLNSIQILRPKLMLAGFVEYLLGFTMSSLSSLNFSITKNIIQAKLSSAITKIIEANDMEVEDCYTSFSNEEYDELLDSMMYSKYTATNYSNNSNKYDTSNYLTLLDNFNASATKEESITTITKLLEEVKSTIREEGSTEYELTLTGYENFLKNLLWAIIMPIIQSLFTPQVMLLLAINMHLMGISDLRDLKNLDLSKILKALLNQILSLIKVIVRYILDVIIEIILKIFMNRVMPLLIKWMAALQTEKLRYWVELLTSAIQCLAIPIFNLQRYKTVGAIDDVRYADIVDYSNNNEATTPESTNNC